MQKKRNKQNSSCPEGQRPPGIVILIRLTKRQQR